MHAYWQRPDDAEIAPSWNEVLALRMRHASMTDSSCEDSAPESLDDAISRFHRTGLDLDALLRLAEAEHAQGFSGHWPLRRAEAIWSELQDMAEVLTNRIAARLADGQMQEKGRLASDSGAGMPTEQPVSILEPISDETGDRRR